MIFECLTKHRRILVALALLLILFLLLLMQPILLNILVVFILVLFLPGYSLLFALFKKKFDTIEVIALSFGLSIFLVAVTGLILFSIWNISLASVISSSLILILVFMLFGVKRKNVILKEYINEIIDYFTLNKNNHVIYVLILVAIIAFVFRLYLQQNVYFILGDASHYLDLARNIVENNAFLSDSVIYLYSPNQKTVPHYEASTLIGYPILISYLAQFLSQDYLLSGKLICVIAGSFLIFPTFLIAKTIFNSSKIGILSAILVAFFPHLALLSVVPFTDIIYVYLALLALYFLCFKRSDKDTLIILGILISASFMIRYQSLNLIFVVFATYLFQKKRLKNIAIIGTSFVVATFPLFLYKYLIFGSPFFIDIKPFSVYDPQTIAVGLTASPSLTTAIIEDPLGFLHFFANSSARNLVYLPTYLAPDILPLRYIFVLFAGLVIFIGCVCTLRRWKIIFPLYLFIFSSIAFVSVRLGAGLFWRKNTPLFPILIIFFVIGMIGIIEWITQYSTKKWNNKQRAINNTLANKILVVIFIFLVPLYAIGGMTQINSSHWVAGMNDLERSTDFIVNHTSKDDVIMEQGSFHLLYLSNRKLVLPPSDYADILTVASRYNISYLWLNERFLSDDWGRGKRPDLIDTFFNGSFPSAFIPVYKYKWEIHEVRVFEINQTIPGTKWYNMILSMGDANFSDVTFKPVYNKSNKVEIDFSINSGTPMLLFFSLKSNAALNDLTPMEIIINNNSFNEISIISEKGHDYYVIKVNETNILPGRNKIIISDVHGNDVTLDFIEVYQQLDTLSQAN